MISPDVVDRIANAALVIGYRRDLIAASLRTSRTRLVGMLVPDLANPVFAPIVAGVEAALAERQLRRPRRPCPQRKSGLELVEGLVGARVEGLILATAHARRSGPRPLARARPADRAGQPGDPEGRFSAATPDDREGMRFTVRHLVGSDMAHRPSRRTAGRLYRFFAGRGLPKRDGRGRTGAGPVVGAEAYTREAGEAAAERLMARRGGLTAIAAANDLIALGAMRAVAARGLSCPTTFPSADTTICPWSTWCSRR